MHNYIYILKRLIPAMLTASVLVAASGCIKDHVISPADSEVRDVALRLVTTGSGSTTRSAGEDPFNENLINRALIFFYPAVSDDGDDTPAVTCWVESPIGKTGKHEVTNRRLSAGEVQEIFGEEGTQAGRVFVVVNLPTDITLPENASINQIRHTAVTADFRNGARYDKGDEEGDDYDEEQGGINESEIQSGVQNEFVMLGEALLEYNSIDKAVTGEVPLTRTAAKIRLALNIPDDIQEADPENPEQEIKWVAQKDQIRIFITNGVSKAHIGGDILPVKPKSEVEGAAEHDDYLEETDFYSLNPRGGDWSISRRVTGHESDITPENPKGYTWWHDVPIYSYPHQWESTPTEEHQPYLVVMVPWRKSGDGVGVEFQYYYYQVPINLRGGTVTEDDNRPKDETDELDEEDGDDSGSGGNGSGDDSGSDLPAGDKGGFADGGSWNINSNTIESNMYYLLKLEIGMLGSLKYEEPLHIEAQYYVVPWQNETINAELKGTRYLVVDQQAWEMNNTTDLDIPFYTSHETVIARVKYRFWNFNPAAGTYTDDGQTININYDGKPLQRTFTWELGKENAIFNKSIEEARKQRLGGNPDSSSDVIQQDSIFSFSLDPTNFIVHYHHELKRWMEYTDPDSNGNEVEVWGTKFHRGERHWRVGEYGYQEDTPQNVGIEVNGYYGEWKGATKYLKPTLTTITDKDGNEQFVETDEWSKIEVEITIAHKDQFEQDGFSTRFLQTIYITQYPPMYISAEESPVTGGSNAYGATVFVNNNQAAVSGDNMWTSVNHGVSTSSNPNMYIITITQLSDPSVRIGDPRSLYINNNLSNSSAKLAQATTPTWTASSRVYKYFVWDETSENKYDWEMRRDTWTTDQPDNVKPLNGNGTLDNQGRRRLQFYFPADESTDAGSKAEFIAPQLRIASSFGNIAGQTTREEARRRCAAYQEGGRPAGRWRLPTQAEIQFITQLSRSGRIPTLFATWHGHAVYAGTPHYHRDDTPYRNYPHYWSAQGAAYIDDTDNGTVKLYPDPLYEQYGTHGATYKPSTQPADAAANEYNAVQVAVRCVYDEWYWTDTCPVNTFTWGDEEKANPQDPQSLTNSAAKTIINAIKGK